MKTDYRTRLTLLCAVKFFLLIIIALYSMIALAPDEAQYWTWSQALDLGYYSKPPAISWQIFLTTALFGNNELGVRIGAMIIGTLLTISVYLLARAASLSPRSSFLSALVFACSPLGFYLSFAATTDGGATLFFTLALLPIVKALVEKTLPNYFLVGCYVALGALYKWSIFFLWPLLIVALFFFAQLRTRNIVWGVLLSLLGLIPSLYWNMTHEWATYKHVFSTLFGHSGRKTSPNFWGYLGGQIVLFSPLFFGMLVYSIRKVNTSSLRFIACIFWVAVSALLLSCFKKMQINWVLCLYPPLMVLIGWVAAEKHKLLLWATVFSITSIFASILIPNIQMRNYLPLSYKLNPYRQNMGVREVTALLEEVGYDADKEFLFSDKYQNASLVSFYSPEQKRAYFFNLGGARKNQFSYWPQMSEYEKGKTGYFVVIENSKEENIPWYIDHYKERLGPYFTSVNAVGKTALFSAQGRDAKYALLFKCEGYLGSLPPTDSKKY
jgi:hypothetical protein